MNATYLGTSRVNVIAVSSQFSAASYPPLDAQSSKIRLVWVPTAKKAVQLIESAKFDLVLLWAGEQDGHHIVDALRTLMEAAKPIPVLVAALDYTKHNAVKLLRNGASGYVGFASVMTELEAAIYSTMRGNRYVS